ncbi:MAG TPA: DUF1553 domain-containing protein [Polyangiales bacterium]|nr:DUF1553 domain-containing protein [Polyangiales bacterium]
MIRHRARAVLLFCGLWAASPVWGQDTGGQRADASALQCPSPGAGTVGLERRLRQLYLDLLGRPPTIAEYRELQGKGEIGDEDIDALMTREDFFSRMKRYHRALLRANVSASLPDNRDMRLSTTTDGAKPLESRGNASSGLRGRNGTGCDHFIPQDDCKNPALQQDPQAEVPASAKVCRDAHGVPMPVSFDYDTNVYACTALTGATSCTDAVTKGMLEAKHLFFCDMRRSSTGLAPFKCLPDPGKPTTAALKTEVLDGENRVIAFTSPMPASGAAFDKLERCTLTLTPKNGVLGTFANQRGCVQREGWVMAAAPFWDTSGSTEVAACAIEAQTRDLNPATLASCDGSNFLSDRSCGCGQGFRRCEAGDESVSDARVAAINEEPLLIADAVLRRDEDYFQILTSRRSFINGVLASLYRDNQAIGALAITPPAARDALPALTYTASPNDWVEYLRADNASGVLTTPAWLYRFPTQRSRVAQFYEAFLCKTFSPPADAVSPNPEDSCNRENNLAKRCGCNYCHATIEPTGAHWGRFGERNAQYLDPMKFPKFDAKCRDCALAGNTGCDGECGNYVMQAYDGDGASSLGMLKSYLYRTESDEPNVAGGPRMLVERMMQTGDLERCVVSRIWNEFLGRPMTSEEQDLYMDSLAQDFLAHGRNLKQLIRHVVTTDAYRRVD